MAADGELSDLDAFGDLTIPVEVRIGKCVMKVGEIAALQCGSTIFLDRSAGETMELRVGNLRLGMAEVVVNEDRLSVRITEVFLPELRPAAQAARV
jgi:flagellar motor switch protein FliN